MSPLSGASPSGPAAARDVAFSAPTESSFAHHLHTKHHTMSSPDPDATDSSGDEHETKQRNGEGKSAAKATMLSGAASAPTDAPMDGMPALQSMAEVAFGSAHSDHGSVVMAQPVPASSSAHVPLHKAHSTGMATLAVPITTATIVGGAAGGGRPPVSPQRAHGMRTPSPNGVSGGIGRRSPSSSPLGVQPQRTPNGSPLTGMNLSHGSRSSSPGVVTASIIEEGGGTSSSARPVVAMAVPVVAAQLGPQTQRSDNPQIVMASVSVPPPPRSHKKAPSIGASPQGSPTHQPVAASSHSSSGSGTKKNKSNHTSSAGDQSDSSERGTTSSSNVFNEDVDALLQLAMFSAEADDSALAPKKSGSAPVPAMTATAALLASDKKRKSKAMAEGTGPVVAQPVVASIIPSPAASSAPALASTTAAAAHSNTLPSVKKQKLGLPMSKSVSGGGGSTTNLSPTLAAAVPAANGLKKEASSLALVSPATIVQGQQIKKATKVEGSPLKGPTMANAMPTVMASAVYEGNGGMPMHMQQPHPQAQMQMHPQPTFEMMGPNGPQYMQQHPFDPMQGYAVDPRTGMHMQIGGPYGMPGQFIGVQNGFQFAPFPPQQQQQQQPGQPGSQQPTMAPGPNGQQQFMMNGAGSVGSMQSSSLGPQQLSNGGGMPNGIFLGPGSFYGPNGQLVSAGPGSMMMGPGGFMPGGPQQQPMGPMGYSGGPLGMHPMQMQMQPQQQQQQMMGAFAQQQHPPHMMMQPAQPLMPMLGASLSPTNKRCARHVEIAYYIHLQKAQAQANAAAAAQQGQTVPDAAAAATAVPSADGAQPMAGVTGATVEAQPPQQNGTTAAVTALSEAPTTTSAATATAVAPVPAAAATTTAAITDAVAPATSPALAPSSTPALSSATAATTSSTVAAQSAQPGTGSPPMLTGAPALASQQQQMPPMQLQPGGLNPMQQMQMQPGMGPMSMPMQMQPGFPDPTLEARRLKQQRDWMRQAPGMGPQPFGPGVGGDLAYQQHLMSMQQGFPMQAGLPNGPLMFPGAPGAGFPGGLHGQMPGGPMGPAGARFLPGLGQPQQQQLMQGMGGPGQFVAQPGGNWPPPPQQAGGMQPQQPMMMEYMMQPGVGVGGMPMHPSMAAMQQQFNPHMQPPHVGLMGAVPPQAPLQPPQQLAPLSASIVPLPPNGITTSVLAPPSASPALAVSAAGSASSLGASPPSATAVATSADAPVAIALALPLASPLLTTAAPVVVDTVVAASASTAPAAAVAVVPVAESAPAPLQLASSMPLVGSA